MAIQKPAFTIPVSLGTVTTGNERSNRLASYLGLWKDAGMVWQSNGNTNLFVRCDFGSAKAVNYVSLIAANAQPGTTIRVRIGDTQAEVDGTADYDSGFLPFISPAITRADGLYNSHLDIPSLQTKRWIRIDIGGHTGDFEASSLVVGQRMIMNRFYDRGFEMGVEDLGSLEFGNQGVVVEEDGVIIRSLGFKLSWMSEAEFETNFRPFMEQMGMRGFIHCCFDPEPTIYRQAKTYFGRMAKQPTVVNSVLPLSYAKEFVIHSPY
jgi:hypothetical protein